MTKAKLQELWENKTVKYVFLGIFALLLLLAIWKVFFPQTTQTSANYEFSDKELQIASLLQKLDGVEESNVIIEEGTENARVVIFFQGRDGISLRMKMLEITSVALNIPKQNIQVYPVG